MRLTKKSIDALRPTDRDQIFWDDNLKGFGLRMNPGGKRSFVIQYRNTQGRSCRITVGPYGRLTPEEAREAARRMLSQVHLGDDPSVALQVRRNAITVAELCQEYFDKAEEGLIIGRGGKRKKSSTLCTDQGRVKRHVLPLLGKNLAREVRPNDIRAFIESVTLGKTAGIFKTEKLRGKAIVKGGEGAARRATAMLSGIFAYAVRVGHCDFNPCVGVQRTADNRKSIRLGPDNYKIFAERIRKAEQSGAHWQFCAIARLLAITGLRRSEAINLRVNEIDLAHRCVRLADSKTGPSTRPLGEPALRLLADLVEIGQTFVFPSLRETQRPYGAFAKTWRKHLGSLGLTPHSLRHGYASAAFELGCSETLVAHMLGHATARTTTQGYIRPPQRMVVDAADRVARYIEAAMSGQSAEIVKLASGEPTRN